MSFTESTYFLIFISGLLGGFGHCMGMCGPVVAACSLHHVRKSYLTLIYYNCGRITTYSIIGGIMGLTGSFVAVITPLGHFQYAIMALLGGLMAIMGLFVGGWIPLKSDGVLKGCTAVVSKMARFVSETESDGAFFPMGMIVGFIPCVLSYSAFIAAAAAGVGAGSRAEGFIKGMSLLFLFGLGTLPALLLLGSLLSAIGQRAKRALYKASACTMIAAGVLLIYRSVTH